jgi:hypothetical protein
MEEGALARWLGVESGVLSGELLGISPAKTECVE